MLYKHIRELRKLGLSPQTDNSTFVFVIPGAAIEFSKPAPKTPTGRNGRQGLSRTPYGAFVLL